MSHVNMEIKARCPDPERVRTFLRARKFHIDDVEGLGSFVEIEAIGEFGEEERLRAPCDLFRERLGVEEGDIEGRSHSDLLRDPGGASG